MSPYTIEMLLLGICQRLERYVYYASERSTLAATGQVVLYTSAAVQADTLLRRNISRFKATRTKNVPATVS